MNKNIIYALIALIAAGAIVASIIFFGTKNQNTDQGDSRAVSRSSESQVGGSGEFLSDFVLTNLKGKEVAYKDLSGQVTFIRFSSTTCVICKSENPELNKVLADPPANARLLEINIAEPREAVLAYQEQEGLNIETLLDQDGSATINNHVLGTPTHVFLHPDGSVCDRSAGNRFTAEALKTQIEACR